jgi:hypothetical protein
VAAAPSFTHVRLFKVAQDANESKLDDFAVAPETPWGAPTLTNIVSFSATCFFVARDLYTDLGGEVAVGVVQSASGGTAVRNWAPIEALAKCPQPYNSPDRYGTHPYEHAVLYNAMIHPLTTGPTSISFVIWDQAESDSFPQTPLGYYGCQTTFHVDSWRRAFGQPTLPWLFVHLQPYTGSGPCCLPDLRAMQLQALALPAVGFASAVDLGDPSSPLGNVHFQVSATDGAGAWLSWAAVLMEWRGSCPDSSSAHIARFLLVHSLWTPPSPRLQNKQVVSQRLVAVALQLAFDRPRTTDGYGAWPPPAFLTQSVQSTESKFEVAVTLAAEAPFSLMFGATVDILNQTSAICPATVDPGNCSGFEVLTSDGVWHPATAKISGASVLLSATATVIDTVGSRKLAVSALSVATTPYAVGSRYAWNAWPLATLFAANKDGSPGLPILPWQQALTMAAPSA